MKSMPMCVNGLTEGSVKNYWPLIGQLRSSKALPLELAIGLEITFYIILCSIDLCVCVKGREHWALTRFFPHENKSDYYSLVYQDTSLHELSMTLTMILFIVKVFILLIFKKEMMIVCQFFINFFLFIENIYFL